MNNFHTWDAPVTLLVKQSHDAAVATPPAGPLAHTEGNVSVSCSHGKQVAPGAFT